VGHIENAFPYHLQGANGTGFELEPNGSYHAVKFEENVIHTTAVRSQIRSVAILLDDHVVVSNLPEYSLRCVDEGLKV
jgi:hypothetical protein